MKRLSLGLLTVVLITSAVPAYAHGGDCATVTGISPAFAGVSATSTRDGDALTVTSAGTGSLVVIGYFAEALQYEAGSNRTEYATWAAIGVVVAGFGVIQFGVRPLRRRRSARTEE